jgi:hypothetical protein
MERQGLQRSDWTGSESLFQPGGRSLGGRRWFASDRLEARRELVLHGSDSPGKLWLWKLHLPNQTEPEYVDPNVVAGMFTWEAGLPWPHRELDFEFAR